MNKEVIEKRKESYHNWWKRNKSLLKGLPKKEIKELWKKEMIKEARRIYNFKQTIERKKKQTVRVKQLSNKFSTYNSKVGYEKDENGRLKLIQP